MLKRPGSSGNTRHEAEFFPLVPCFAMIALYCVFSAVLQTSLHCYPNTHSHTIVLIWLLQSFLQYISIMAGHEAQQSTGAKLAELRNSFEATSRRPSHPFSGLALHLSPSDPSISLPSQASIKAAQQETNIP